MSLLEIAQEVGLDPMKVACTQGGEYHSACPSCGGKDRFVLQPNKKMKNCYGGYWCRQCNIHGDVIQFCKEFLGLSFKEAVVYADADIPEQENKFLRKESHIMQPCLLNSPSEKWMQKALLLVEYAHAQIWTRSDVLKRLMRRGLPAEAIRKYKIGFWTDECFCDRIEWGLGEEMDANGNLRRIWLPEGIVIPIFDKNNVVRLKIRRNKWKEGDDCAKYIAISGSMNGLSLIGDIRKLVMIVVESELDAYALHYVVGDFAFIVAVGSNIKNPDNVTDRLVKEKKDVLICHDNDAAGKKMLEKWVRLYPHVTACSTENGKDIGEAIEMGVNVRAWILSKVNLIQKIRAGVKDKIEETLK